MSCPNLAVPRDVMQHVVHVESSNNPYAIGVVGGRLVRQPRNLAEALATARDLERRGFNFSVGLAQVNRYNFAPYGLASYEQAFDSCQNLRAGSRILAECHGRSGGDWGKSFSCYYSGNFTTGFRHGYVQKVYASMRDAAEGGAGVAPIRVVGAPAKPARRALAARPHESALTRRVTAAGGNSVARREAIPAAVPALDGMSEGAAAPQAAARIASAQPLPSQPPVAQANVVQVPAVPATPPVAAATPEDGAFVF